MLSVWKYKDSFSDISNLLEDNTSSKLALPAQDQTNTFPTKKIKNSLLGVTLSCFDIYITKN